MKYKKMTAHEFSEKIVRDIHQKRKREMEGKKQAFFHCMENREKIKKRLDHGR